MFLLSSRKMCLTYTTKRHSGKGALYAWILKYQNKSRYKKVAVIKWL